jgi:UPF0755 protein
MDGFKRPRAKVPQLPSVDPRVVSQVQQQRMKQSLSSAPLLASPLDKDTSTDKDNGVATQSGSHAARPSKRKTVIGVIIAVIGAMLLVGGFWAESQLKPVSTTDESIQKVEIKDGTAFSYIVKRLKERGLIKNELVFNGYAELTGKRANVKAGTCMLKPTESSQEILEKLTTGCHDFKSITFFPGATIEKPLYKPAHAEIGENMHVKGVLSQAGFSDAEIAAALKKTYSSPLFADKPKGTSLEGYIYGETYYVDVDATAEKVLETTFAEMYKAVEPLVPEYKKQGLNLYQAITMASIIQRELNCEGKPEERRARCQGYQETIAQIFMKRLKENITLGSDVTFIYAADQRGVTPTVDIDSPYNTRKNPGLPPGPIAVPGPSALKALAHPTNTDYLFFIAGDDGLIYFAKTDAEHQQNIKNHCQKLCNEL